MVLRFYCITIFVMKRQILLHLTPGFCPFALQYPTKGRCVLQINVYFERCVLQRMRTLRLDTATDFARVKVVCLDE